MYRAKFRVACISVQCVLDHGFNFKVDDDGNEYSPTGHVNIINGQVGAIIWSANALGSQTGNKSTVLTSFLGVQQRSLYPTRKVRYEKTQFP